MPENSIKNSPNAEMSFLDHLEALRWHLVRSAIAVVTLGVTLFFMKDLVFDTIILGPKHTDFLTYRLMCRFSHFIGAGENLCINTIPFSLINTELAGQFTMHMWIAFVGGLIIAFPYILWEIWRFIKPALNDKERNSTSGFVFFASILFLTGVLFSYYMIVPLTINFLGSYQVSTEISNTITMDSYISTVTTLTLATGLVFELPIVVYFLTRFGILSAAFMRQYRKHAAVVILIVAAVITPSPDISSQLLVAIPLYILYEASIFVSRYVERIRAKRI
ncbi:MAG: twin-arginine translocase subunit TatC [Bacteroidia bacterium]|nr:twin-arginine translocase subunit TatC [Bacteroidia bacterium]